MSTKLPPERMKSVIAGLTSWWKPARPHDHVRLRESLRSDEEFNLTFAVLVFASCLIATFGLLENSVAVIIGAMIIAPLMSPIQSFAFGAAKGEVSLFRGGLVTLAAGSVVAIVTSAIVGKLVGFSHFGSEVLSRTRPTLFDLGIAFAAGAVGGFAKVRPEVSSSVAGTAVAVALMPPLCVAGLELASGHVTAVLGALLLFVTNLLGITLACMIVYLLAGHTVLGKAHRAIGWTLALTAIVAVPLGISLFELLREARLEGTLRTALLQKTGTFQRAQLVSADFDWFTKPPTAHLLVRAQGPITPTQVSFLDSFAARATGQQFELVFDVIQMQEVTQTSAGAPQAPDATGSGAHL
ncbi:MAG: DUF389 domain-containing protein [Acidobacteriota bacterium]|nr:DUF389 domain-containing protein [Acidobacteriota bacterium]